MSHLGGSLCPVRKDADNDRNYDKLPRLPIYWQSIKTAWLYTRLKVIERPLKRDNERAGGETSVLDVQALEEFFRANDIKMNHVNTVYREIFKRGRTAFWETPDIGRKTQDLLKENFVLTTSKVVEVAEAEDGSGAKLIIELKDGHRVETVIINHTHKARKRSTVCVSSQVGCAMGCTFCATGTMGLQANLTAGEIIEQVWHARQYCTPRNVVFMGMGEPMDNYEEVLVSLRGLTQQNQFNVCMDRITVSTVGVVNRIQQLADDCPEVSLALSLHSSNQALRTQIIPSGGRFTVDKLQAAIDYYIERTGRQVMLEYTLMGGLNDLPIFAKELCEFIQTRKVFVNLIPYNPTEIGALHGYMVPKDDDCIVFEDILNDFGIKTKIGFGTDITAFEQCLG
eukprot:gene1039-1571_t